MLKYNSFFWITVLTCLATLRSVGSEVEMSSGGKSLIEYINELREHGLPIDFFQAEWQSGDKITRRDRILAYELKKKAGTIQNSEAILLAQDEMAISRDPSAASSIVNWRQREENLTFVPSDKPDDVLNKLVGAFPGYAWMRSNTSIVVYAKDTKISLPPDTEIASGSFIDVVNSFNTVLMRTANLEIVPGAGSPSSIKVWNILSKRRLSGKLNLGGLSLQDAVSRLAEALGPDVVWTIIKGERGGIVQLELVSDSPHV